MYFGTFGRRHAARLCAASRKARIKVRPETMFDLGRTFLAVVERSPSAPAIADGKMRLSYAQWYADVSGVPGGLRTR